jgi:hypothetical protein
MDVSDPEGPRECFDFPLRGCPPNDNCQHGRAGRSRITLAVPSEIHGEVLIAVHLTAPARGFCYVEDGSVVRTSGPASLAVRDLNGDGRAELLLPHRILAGERDDMLEFDLVHPYALEGQDMVLRPSLAQELYVREAEAWEDILRRTQGSCQRHERAGDRARCEMVRLVDAQFVAALRHAGSCSGAESR